MNKTIALSDITASKKLQTRTGGLSAEHVQDLKAAYAAKEDVPLMRVWEIKGKAGYHLTRGFHRLEALKLLDRVKIEVEVKSGTWGEALTDAVQGNFGHGMRRTNKDKNRCVELLIATFPDETDREIAERAGVSHTFVASVREPEEKEPKPTKTPLQKMQDTLAKMAKEKLDLQTLEAWLKAVIESAEQVAHEFKKQGGLF